MAEDFTPATTGAGLVAMAPDAQRKLWQKGLLTWEQSSDFWSEFEGGENAVIMTETDTSKGAGQTITYTTASGFYKEGKRGDARFDGPEDFEGRTINTFQMKVDWIRHGYADNERAEELMGMRGEIREGVNVELGKWLGRLKTEQMFGAFVLLANTANIRYANGKTLDTLKSADIFDWDNIVTGAHMMKPLGGKPAKNSSTPEIWSNLVVGSTQSLLSLKLDPAYRQVLADASERGALNKLFKGGYPTIDGQTIAEYNAIDHDGIGAVGSFIAPKAYLGTAVTAGTTAIDIQGGGNATDGALTYPLYFKYFAGHAYNWIDGTDYSPAAGTNYFLICNLTGADAGKVGMYSYANATGNNGNKIVINGRLGSAASGIRATTLGNVTWDSGVWAGKHTDAHPSGSLIIPCNSYGVPFGRSLILGKMAALRGYGKYRGTRRVEEQEGGFINRRYIWSVFGQKIMEDRKNRQPGLIQVVHALYYPELSLPTVT